MLRISKKERQQLYNLNARIRKLQKENLRLYNLQTPFITQKPAQFLTRREVNLYKQEAKDYLKKEQYVMGGQTRSSANKYFFPIPKQEIREIRHLYSIQRKYARQMGISTQRLNYQIKGRLQPDVTVYQQMRMTKMKGDLRSSKAQYFEMSDYFNPAKISNREQLDRYKYGLKTFHNAKAYASQNNLARDNYISALINTFGEKNTKEIIEVLELLTPRQFSMLYESDKFIDFDFVYDIAYAMELLRDVAQGIYQFLFQSGIAEKRKFTTGKGNQILHNLLNTLNLSSEDILNSYKSHYIKFQYKGLWYEKQFRTKDIERIRETGITENDLKGATYLGEGNIVPQGIKYGNKRF